MRLKHLCWLTVLFFCFLVFPMKAEKNGAEAGKKVQRLVKLCEVWGKVKYFHPYLAYKDIDWDAALVDILPVVDKAQTEAEFVAALEKMLARLDDPLTAVQPSNQNPEAHTGPPIWESISSETIGGFLVITFGDHAFTGSFGDFTQALDKLRTLAKDLEGIEGVLFDFRKARKPVGASEYGEMLIRSGLISKLFSGSLLLPGSRSRFHYGFAKQSRFGTDLYYSGFMVSDPKRLEGGKEVKEKPLVFLANRNSELPEVALALQWAGKGAVVVEGALVERAGDASIDVKLSGSLKVKIRLGELVMPDGGLGMRANLTCPEPPVFTRKSKAFQEALDLLRKGVIPPVKGKKFLGMARSIPEKKYARMVYPSREYRLLALFKGWSIINYYFPYKDLMDEDWTKILARFIPPMEQAGDAAEYGLVLSEMMRYTQDSHVGVSSLALAEHYGRAVAPVLLRLIEDRPVVVMLLDKKAAADAGIELGDVILKIKGKPVKQCIQHYARYTAASTPQALGRSVMFKLLRGKDNSRLPVTVKGKDGNVREVEFLLKRTYYRGYKGPRTGEVFRLINKDLGYADLARLESAQVEKMFALFKDTRGIIFDMRGYPRGTAWSIAPYLTDDPSLLVAKFKGVMATPGEDSRLSFSSQQRISATPKGRYRGKTVMLIDERTVSQAEHTGLFFEAANGTRFAGGGTVGANGDVTMMALPGGVRVSFTGMAVFHADGRQLQRIGLEPHLEVKPTIKGIREGRDEVMEAAVKYLTQWIEEK